MGLLGWDRRRGGIGGRRIWGEVEGKWKEKGVVERLSVLEFGDLW